MDERYRKMTDFLVGLGTDKVEHSGRTFLAHLIGVHRDLESWGCDHEICRAGMFHSIYGTEPFQKFKVPLEQRGEVRELIGERAERLAYLNCAMTRATFDESIEKDEGPYTMVDRFTGDTVELSPQEFEDLATVHLCDWLEQVERDQAWDRRRKGFRRLADMLSGVAKESYERVFTREPQATVSAGSAS